MESPAQPPLLADTVRDRANATANKQLVEAMVRDLQHVGGYVEAQLAAGRERDSIIAIQADAVLHRLRNLAAVNMDQGMELIRAVTGGPWNDEQKQNLSRAIDDLVAHSRLLPKRRGLQSMPRPENTLTDVEWRSLRDPGAILSAKIAQVATRMWSLGLTRPSEPTSFKYAGIICVCSEIVDPEEQKEVFKSLKAAVNNLDESRAYPNTHLRAYPDDMDRLPKAIFEYAYQGQRPITMSLPELDVVMMGTQLRERTSPQNKQQKMLLQGLRAIKDDAANAGVSLNIGSNFALTHARGFGSRVDERCPSGEPGAASDVDGGTVVDLAVAARLKATPLNAFKPQLALPAASDATSGEGTAAASGTAAHGDTLAVEQMMREAGVATGMVKRRRVRGKQPSSAMGARSLPAAGKKRYSITPRPRQGWLQQMQRNGSKGVGCSKCRYLPKGCAQCRNPFYRPRKPRPTGR